MPRTRNNSGDKKTKRRYGPEPSYRSEYCRLAYVNAREGLSRNVLADALGVSISTIDRWEREHPKFKKAIHQGWYACTTQKVERSLKNLCIGYETVETTTEDIVIKKGKGEDAIELPAQKLKVVKKQQPPNVMAVIFWLTNRTPDLWQHVQKTIFSGKVQEQIEQEINATVDNQYNLKNLPKEDLMKLKLIIGKVIRPNSKIITSAEQPRGLSRMGQADTGQDFAFVPDSTEATEN